MPQILRIVALANTAAGTHRHSSTELHEQLVAAFSVNGIQAEVEVLAPTKITDRARHALARAMRGEIDAVVAGGGDGTIRAVAETLVETGVPLGILPLGTLNHFAKDIGVPIDVDGAVAMIAAGHTRAVDIGEVNTHVFLNNSSIGLYPYMVLDRERRQRKAGLNKWIATVLAAYRTLRYLPVRRMWLGVNGRARAYRTPLLFVGNNPYEIGLPAIGTRPRIDRGVLWLCIAQQKTRLALLWLAIKTLFGFVKLKADLETLNVATAEVNTRTSRLAVAIDGEVQIMRPPLLYRSRPLALLVFAPPPHGGK